MSMFGNALGMGRRMAESRMTDTISVSRGGGEWLNPETDEYEDVDPSDVYSGPARIRHGSGTPGDVEAGSQLLTVGALEVHVPVGSAVFQPDDLITVTACPTRPDQVGRKFIVVAPFDGSGTTAVRYRVEVFDGRLHGA